jgi:hypothetical protein
MNTRQGSLIYAARSRILLAFLSTSLFWLGSCRTNPPGQISIDRAEVFTRERLVNRRLQEQQWLEKKLDFATLETTFQGSSDLREFRGIMAALKGQFDPLGGTLQEATLNSQIKDRQRQEELAALKQDTSVLRAEIDRLKAEQDLAKLKQTPGADVAGSPAASAAAAATSPSAAAPSDASALAGTWESLQKGNPPDSQEARTTSAKLTSVEKLRDEMAYRNAVHAALREAELDDAHDINGYALRTLKFDISIMPHDERAEHIGMIRLTAEPDTPVFDDPKELEDVYRSWQDTMLQQTRLEVLSLQRRYMQGFLTDDDIIQSLAARGHVQEFLLRQIEEPQDTPDNAGSVRDPNREPHLRGAMAGLDALQFNESRHQLDCNTAMALCKIVEWRYASLHGRYLYFNDIPIHIQVDGRTLSLPDLWPNPESMDDAERRYSEKVPKALAYRKAVLAFWTTGGTKHHEEEEEELEHRKAAAAKEAETLRCGEEFRLAKLSYEIRKDADRLHEFARDIHRLNCEFKPYVYTVEPKELAQNISDVAAAEKLSSLVLAASAALPQSGVNAGGYLNQLARSQVRLQAILRRPLVVGFVGREDQQEDRQASSFGWALGPRFEIDPSCPQVHYRQAAAQHSVQATLAVPGWWDRIVFRYQVSWRDPSAHCSAQRKMQTQWKEERCLTVDLSRDYEAITSALLGLHEAREQDPAILPAKAGDPRTAPYLLTEGEEKAALLIRGANLWRFPQVFIGGQKAETVAVLPDMGGLYATFDKVRLPTTVDRGSARVDLTIVTSQGVARLPQAVQILPKATVKPSGTVELKTACAAPDGKVRFVATSGLIPDTSYFGAHLRARDITRMTWSDVMVKSVKRETGDGGATAMEFELDPIQKLVAQPTRLMFDLAIQDEYGTPYHSVPSFAGVKGELVYFPSASQAKLKLVGKTPGDKEKTESTPGKPSTPAYPATADFEFRTVASPDKPETAGRRETESSSGKSSPTYRATADLIFQTDPNVDLDLFKRAHPWITEEKTAFRLRFTPVPEGLSIQVPLGPGAIQLSGTKPGRVSVGASLLMGRDAGENDSRDRRLFQLCMSAGAPAAEPKYYNVKIEHPNEKDAVEVDGKLRILIDKPPEKPAQKVPGNRE